MVSADHGMEALSGVCRSGRGRYLCEHTWHPDGRAVCDGAGAVYSAPHSGAHRTRTFSLPAQSICSLHSAEWTTVQSVWGGTGFGNLVVFRIRATLYRSRRSGSSPTQLPDRFGDRCSAVNCHLFSAHIRIPGCARQLAAVAHRILFRGCATDRGPLVRPMDDDRGDGHERGTTEQYSADYNAHAICD